MKHEAGMTKSLTHKKSGNGLKPASITAVANYAGVSIATVSRIMNGIQNKASLATQQRVRAAIDELGYRPVTHGQSLRRGESRVVSLHAVNLANPTMAAIAASAETALRAAGYTMVLCDTHDQADLQDATLLDMRAHLVKAYVLLGAMASPQLSLFQRHKESILYVNRRPHGTLTMPHDYVGIDNMAAGIAVAQYFHKRGLVHCGLIHGAAHSPATVDRITGFKSAALELGLTLNKNYIVSGRGLGHLQIGYDGVDKILSHGALPEALFCSSDLIAYGAHRRLSELGFEIPRDIVLMGFDDNPLNDWVAPWLNSVSVPYAQFGDAIVKGLKAIWTNANREAQILPFKIVERI
jgi:LacI family transcriptional regulator